MMIDNLINDTGGRDPVEEKILESYLMNGACK
jgi:hypothetical protein